MGRAFTVAFLVAVILVAIGVGAALSERFRLAAETSQPVTCVPDGETKGKIRAIMLEAIDESLKEHIVRLHETWMKDDTGQPARATNGARRGIRAYIGARAAAMKWDPPLC